MGLPTLHHETYSRLVNGVLHIVRQIPTESTQRLPRSSSVQRRKGTSLSSTNLAPSCRSRFAPNERFRPFLPMACYGYTSIRTMCPSAELAPASPKANHEFHFERTVGVGKDPSISIHVTFLTPLSSARREARFAVSKSHSGLHRLCRMQTGTV